MNQFGVPVKGRIEEVGHSVATSGGGLPTTPAPSARSQAELSISQTLQSLGQYDQKTGSQSLTCKKHLAISVFFDGTGNNLKADLRKRLATAS